MTIRYEWDFQHVETILERLINRNKDYGPAWQKVAVQANRSIGQNFRAQGRPGKWAPLAPKTLASRRQRGKGAKILQDNGQLKASITANAAIQTIQPLKLEYGTNLVYAATHQFGRGRIPARPFLRWQDADLEIAKRIFLDHIQGGVI